jgi:CRP-like cAMP-binding protein
MIDPKLFLDDPEDIVQRIATITRKTHLLRTEDEKLMLKNSIRNIRFFREHFVEHYEDMLEEVCEHAKHMVRERGEVVFLQDTVGDLFYIIIKGSVRV